MAKVISSSTQGTKKKSRTALNPENRQAQLISLAYDLVEQRLRDGTATSQETTHFLKLASEESRLKNELLKAQAEKAQAQKEELNSRQHSDELLERAMIAFKKYSGNGDSNEY